MDPRDDHAGKLAPHGSGSLCHLVETLAPQGPPSTAKQQRTALAHFAHGLGRDDASALTIADLTSEQLAAAVAAWRAAGMSAATAQKNRLVLLGLAKSAVAAGYLSVRPQCQPVSVAKRGPASPWSLGEAERIFASARSLPGEIALIPAAHWWTALLAVLADTALPVADVLAIPKIDYDRRTGTLVCGLWSYRLHPRAVAALDAIRFHPHEKLIPWPFDQGQAPFHMLLRRYRELLHRVDLAPVTANLFQRLQVTARQSPSLLADLNWELVVPVRAERLRHLRRRDLERAARAAADVPAPRPKRPPKSDGPQVYRIALQSPRTLLAFFETTYRPQRLADASEDTIEQYRDVIEFLSQFLACDALVACLCEDVVERFLAHRKELGRANATLNRYRCYLLALWRHAWRKRLLDELPRDVFRYSVSKRIPEAWSTEDVSRLVAAAAATRGNVCEISAGRFWVALVLTMYDTGLRLRALRYARCAQLSADGWLSIAAETQKQDADQVFQLHPDTLAAIRATQPETRHYLFGRGDIPSKEWLIRQFRRILKRAGLPCGRRDLFHKLRRTSATAICDAFDEVAAQKHLGHSSLEMTRRYIDPRKLTRTQTAAVAISRPERQEGGQP